MSEFVSLFVVTTARSTRVENRNKGISPPPLSPLLCSSQARLVLALASPSSLGQTPDHGHSSIQRRLHSLVQRQLRLCHRRPSVRRPGKHTSPDPLPPPRALPQTTDHLRLTSTLSNQVSEAASLIARSLPADQRAEFTTSLVDSARAAIPPTPEANPDADEDDETPKAVETPETLAAKKDVVQRLLDAFKENKAVSAQNDKEFEGWSNLVLSLVLSSGVEVSSTVETLLAIYTSPSPSSTSAPTLSARYAALATLFNALPASSASASKLAVLHALVEFTTSNDDVAVLAPVLSSLPTIFAALPLASSSDDELVKIVKVLVASGNEKQARDVLESHGAKTGSLADLQVALSLSASDVYDFSSLSGLTPSSADVQTLLSIFLRGDVAAFSSAAVPASVEGVELSKEQLERKLKLGKLAELCSERVGEQVAYDEVAKVLELSGGEDGEEVETWVIDGAFSPSLSFTPPRRKLTSSLFPSIVFFAVLLLASTSPPRGPLVLPPFRWSLVTTAIRASLLSARLHQPSLSLSVTRALPPSLSSSSSGENTMDVKHWKLIEQRLQGWKQSLERVEETTRRATQGGAAVERDE